MPNNYIFNVFVLKKCFERHFGMNYPVELVKEIVMIFCDKLNFVLGREECIVHDGGELFSFGTNKNNFTKINLLSVMKISSLYCHTIVLTYDNQIYTWGGNYGGQLGLADTYFRYSPCDVSVEKYLDPIDLRHGIKDIYCLQQSSILLTNNGCVYFSGEFNKRTSHCFTKLRFPNIDRMACGSGHLLAVSKTDELYSFGNNQFGQLGAGNTDYQNEPILIPMPKILSVHCATYTSFVITKNYEVYFCGSYLSLYNTEHCKKFTKVNIPDIISMTVGHAHVIAFSKTGDMYSWGCNTFGILGLGDTCDRCSPTKLSLINIVSIRCISNLTLLHRTDGTYKILGYCPAISEVTDKYLNWKH